MPIFREMWKMAKKIWINEFVQPVKSIRLNYLPPLMVYFAAGVSGLTGVVEMFFVTKVLGLQPDFLAVLAYWAGIWWAFKMPIGNLVDRFWRYKAIFVGFGAVLMAASFGVMIGLTGHLETMTKYMSAEAWYIIAALLTPFAYILQDVVADAMTVEAVPRFNLDGTPIEETMLKSEHTTMQLLGRAAILFGVLITAGAAGWFARIPAAQTALILIRVILALVLMAVVYKILKNIIPRRIRQVLQNIVNLNIKRTLYYSAFTFCSLSTVMLAISIYWFPIQLLAYEFSTNNWLAGVKPYEMIYWLAMVIPIISVAGVTIAAVSRGKKQRELLRRGLSFETVKTMLDFGSEEEKKLNWWIIGGSIALLIFIVPLGLLSLTFKRRLESIPFFDVKLSELPLGLGTWLPASADILLFVCSFIIIAWLVGKITKELEKETRRILIGTAIVIFVYRMTPSVGAGMSFFNIEVLRFTEDFIGTLGQVGSIVGLFGLFFLRPMMAKRSLTYIFVFLTLLYSFFILPTVGLVYGIHKWLAMIFASDPYQMARTIALIDTVAASPFGQLAMVPMLAWISKEAPAKYKATYFAIMASFTNLALSASTLGTKYLNEIFVIVKPVYDRNDILIKPGIYDELGPLIIVVGLISLVAPIITILLFTDLRGKGILGFKILDLFTNQLQKYSLMIRKYFKSPISTS